MTLDLEEYQQQAIRVYPLLEYLHKTVEVLKVWKKNSVQEATYLRLVEACLEMSNALLAGEVCTLAKCECCSYSHNGKNYKIGKISCNQIFIHRV